MPTAIRVVDRLQDLADVNTSGATDGQALTKQGTTWLPSSVVSRSSSSRIPTSEAEAALRTALASAVSGDIVDLGGIKHTLTSKLVIPAGVTLTNFDLTAGAHTAIQLAAGAKLARGRSVRVGDLTTSIQAGTTAERSNIVVAGDGCSVLGVDVDGANHSCVHMNGGKKNLVVRGGVYRNLAKVQDAAAVLHAPNQVVGSGLVVEGIRLSDDWATPQGILAFNMSHGRFVRNRLKGIRGLAAATLTGWTVVSGNIYRATDRPDAATRILKNNGVTVTENVTTPTTPGTDEWGISGGFVYLNLGGTDPNTRTITSTFNWGYGITIYAQLNDGTLDMHHNLFAHNDIEDVDGFGIYLQMSDASKGNKTQGNSLKDVTLLGQQDVSLPFAGISVSRGVNTLLEGDTIEHSGLYGVRINKGAQSDPGGHGHSVGVTAFGCDSHGFRTNTNYWTHHGDRAIENTGQGFSCSTAAGDSFLGLRYDECVAESNGNVGLSADNSSGNTLRVVVSGGRYRGNSGHGISLVKCQHSAVCGGVQSWDNTGQQINQANVASSDILITDYQILTGSGAISIAGGTNIALGPGIVVTGTITLPSTWIQTGGIGGGVATYTGTGDPEGVLTAPPGSLAYRRDGGAGTALYVKESGTGNTGWATKAGLIQVDVFTANGTWTKPSWAQSVEVLCVGPGGGGGSGRRGAAGTVRCGGGGGAAGARTLQTFPASALGATETVTVPTGGAGGAARTTNDTDGANGGLPAGQTTFGTHMTASRGSAGNGGTATSGTGGSGGVGLANGGAGGAASTSGGAGAAGGDSSAGGGGGAGGGITTGDSAGAGGAGGAARSGALTNASAGNAGSASATNAGTSGGGGGGGGASTSGAATAGGNGGIYGGGGGGGGASVNGNNSGAGGNGGDGICIVTTYG